ncbi:MAG: ABC transporter substrate-binding protein [Candidatus Methanoperedens sp.]|nr:ABC transporter substrate-binding protein [Candidatus Methanoperedens sp.]
MLISVIPLSAVVYISYDHSNARVNALYRLTVTISLLAVLGVVLLAIVISRRLTKPIKSLADGAIGLPAGNFKPIPISSKNEIGKLTVIFNQIAKELLDAREKLEARIEVADKDLEEKNRELVIANKELKNILICVIMSLAIIGVYEKSQNPKSIYVVSMTADEMSTALINGSIQGFISWEPYPAKAIDSGYGKYLVNSKDIWTDHPSCVLTVSEDLKDEDIIRALVWVQVKGTRFINDPKNHEKALKYGSEFSGLDKNAVSAAINNTIFIEFPVIAETKKGYEILNNAGGFKKSLESMRNIIEI